MAVLGSVLLDDRCLMAVQPIVRPSDFYVPANALVYETMLEVADKGDPCEPLSLFQALQATGRLERVGGADYVAALADVVASPSSAAHYAGVVREKALARSLHRIGREVTARSATEDGDDLLEWIEGEVHGLGVGQDADDAAEAGEVIDGIFADLLAGRCSAPGLETGYYALDALTTGFHGGELIYCAGRPSMGKTSFVVNVAARVAKRKGARVAFFSLEVDRRSVAQSIAACVTGISLQALRDGATITPERHAQAIVELGGLLDRRIFIYDAPSLTPSTMRAQAMRQKAKHGLDLVIVDYLQLMEPGRKFGSREQEISYISRRLKLLARELNVPVIALSQLNRGVESRTDKRPLMSDLRESGSLEQDADVVLMLYREWYYTRNRTQEREAQVIVAKQRNGPAGSATLAFDGECVRFRNPEVKLMEGICSG